MIFLFFNAEVPSYFYLLRKSIFFSSYIHILLRVPGFGDLQVCTQIRNHWTSSWCSWEMFKMHQCAIALEIECIKKGEIAANRNLNI